jgi:hypothetical protein
MLGIIDKRQEVTALERAMYQAVREMLGDGYVPDYYEQIAQDFISIARNFGAKEERTNARNHRSRK